MARTSKGYANHVANPQTPQSRKSKDTQIKNKAGGFVFKIDDWNRLNRFLIIGNEGGTYYASEGELTIENYDCVKRCLALDYKKTIDTIVDISDKGRAAQNAPALFALAVCSVFGDKEAKAYANIAMPKVARYSTDLFTWVHDVLQLKNNKKGKGLLKAIGRWYTEKNVEQLAYQICKYPHRALKSGAKWGHRDLLRLARITRAKKGETARNQKALTLPSDDHGKLFQYATHGVTTSEELKERKAIEKATGKSQEAPGITVSQLARWKNSEKFRYIWAHEQAKNATKSSEIVSLVNDYHITRESIPPQFRNDVEVQRALLQSSPMNALVKNLGFMTSIGLLKPLGKETAFVVDKLNNKDLLKKARIHPMNLLMAMKIYENGHGKSSNWAPVPQILSALEDAFYLSFDYVEPTGKNFFVSCDSSGSMFDKHFSDGHSKLYDRCGITPAEAAACFAMQLARCEKNSVLTTFSTEMKRWNVTNKDSLSSVVDKLNRCAGGGTDCSAPMRYCLGQGLDVDVFVVLTDNETWAGNIHPHEALNAYRRKYNSDAKLMVLGFTATECSIADPEDPGMMDVAGLDPSVPKIISDFALGNI